MRRAGPKRGRLPKALEIGSFNVLELGHLPGADTLVFSLDDPTVVKERIGLDAATQSVFRFIQVGVRFWPWLLLARDLEDGSNPAISKALQRVRSKQSKKVGNRRIGPSTLSSFRPYVSMYKSLMYEGRGSALERFVNDRRRSYDGNLGIFEKNEGEWRRALKKTLGAPAKEFADLLDRAEKEEKSSGGVRLGNTEWAITWALESAETSDALWHACACYAFLRCVYGVHDGRKVTHREVAPRWAERLERALRTGMRKPAEYFRPYAASIAAAKRKDHAPWAHRHRQLLKSARQIFADLRFSTFENLYLRPTPSALDAR